jgi:pimeloyl-ACP methyl ester carboxylesterase
MAVSSVIEEQVGSKMVKGIFWKLGVGAAAVAGLATYKIKQSDKLASGEKAKNYWQTYYNPNTVQRSNELRQTFSLLSTQVQIHLDVYERPEKNAPVVVFNHGAAGYCRLFVEVALMFYDLGYTVVLPDQRGQGYSGGTRGDYTISEVTQNVVDVLKWAKSRYNSPTFVAGGSVGGALTYYGVAASAGTGTGTDVKAVACLNLFDFGNGYDGTAISRFVFLNRYPVIAQMVYNLTRLGQFAGRVRLPFKWFGVFEKLMDDRDSEFQEKWDADPIPPRYTSLRSLSSNVSTPPAIPFERNNIPILVINQKYDKMVDPAVTYRNYERLGGEKRYIEVPFGHWSSQTTFWQTLVTEANDWFRKHL